MKNDDQLNYSFGKKMYEKPSLGRSIKTGIGIIGYSLGMSITISFIGLILGIALRLVLTLVGTSSSAQNSGEPFLLVIMFNILLFFVLTFFLIFLGIIRKKSFDFLYKEVDAFFRLIYYGAAGIIGASLVAGLVLVVSVNTIGEIGLLLGFVVFIPTAFFLISDNLKNERYPCKYGALFTLTMLSISLLFAYII
ncbi:MAG: hypothetical protein ACFFB5_18400 [Promethearchaeota archaeon]